MIESSNFWVVVFFMALGTISIRYSIIGMSSRIHISERAKELFSYIPAAILPALIAPSVFFHQGKIESVFGKERFLVLLVSTAVCLYFRNTFATIASGLIILYLVTQIF